MYGDATSPAIELAREALRSSPDEALTDIQRGFRDRIDAFLVEHGPIALTRECLPGHLTSSCLLWSHDRERVLLHHHRKLGLWLQFGGHCDGEGDARSVATRETIEESGIEPALVTRRAVDFDIHVIPARPGRGERRAEPEHLHLDVRYIAVAPDGAREAISDESLALAWLTPEEARAKDLDVSLLRLLKLGSPSATDC